MIALMLRRLNHKLAIVKSHLICDVLHGKEMYSVGVIVAVLQIGAKGVWPVLRSQAVWLVGRPQGFAPTGPCFIVGLAKAGGASADGTSIYRVEE